MMSLSRAVLAITLALFGSACSSGEPTAPTADLCRTDDDCRAGHCDPKNGCVACLFDSHCAEGERCAEGGCYVPTPCDADAECISDEFPVCDPASRECVRCFTDEQCGDSAHCRSGRCETFATCAAEKDCESGSHCDLGSGECVECLTKGDCDAGHTCVAGQCKLTCDEEADCANASSHCTSAGHCGECADDTHCPGVYHCAAGACVRDVCSETTSSCANDHASVATCSLNGNALSMSACAIGQSCAESGGVAACQPWVCAPGSARCSASGTVETCAPDGLGTAKEEVCESGQRCVAGRCATLACEPNAAFCRGDASYVCSFDGTESTLARTCTASEHCDPGTGKCTSNRCTPNSKSCLGQDLGTCRNDGSGFDYTACGATESCVDGACVKTECLPNAVFCAGKQVKRCNATGTASTLDQTCADRCVTAESYAYCASASCTPGSALCVGNRATTCNSGGSGPETDGIDCATMDSYCEDGRCKPYLCTPFVSSCQGQLMYQCAADGKSLSLASSYPCDSYYWGYSKCNPQTGYCQAPTCTPNSKSCASGKVWGCDSTGYVSTPLEDCTASGKLCSNGACVDKQCEAGTYFCKDGNTHYCADGVVSSLQFSCTASQWCLEGYYGCQPDTCVAGQPTCNGNSVSTCASDGSGPVGAGTPCGANKVCVDGACQATTCNPNQLLCLNGHVQACNSQGTTASLYQYCVAETYCDSASPSCKPDVCPAGKPYCDGESLKTCKPDGSGPVEEGVACKTTSKVCTLSGCATTALDPIGTAGTPSTVWGSSDYILGNLMKVTQPRKLTKLEMSLEVIGGTASANWLVYSSTDGVTFYQVSATPATLAATEETWLSSGALNVTLEAGLYYWVGIELAPASAAYVSYRYDALSTPLLSFAQVLGSSSVSVTGPPASFKPLKYAALYRMQVSTTLP